MSNFCPSRASRFATRLLTMAGVTSIRRETSEKLPNSTACEKIRRDVRSSNGFSSLAFGVWLGWFDMWAQITGSATTKAAASRVGLSRFYHDITSPLTLLDPFMGSSSFIKCKNGSDIVLKKALSQHSH